MTDPNLLGPWVRRFLLDYLVTECNLARNTQRSYRDTLSLLLPFAAQQITKEIDQISVIDVSADLIRLSPALGGCPEMWGNHPEPVVDRGARLGGMARI